jgi:hypothetical protein
MQVADLIGKMGNHLAVPQRRIAFVRLPWRREHLGLDKAFRQGLPETSFELVEADCCSCGCGDRWSAPGCDVIVAAPRAGSDIMVRCGKWRRSKACTALPDFKKGFGDLERRGMGGPCRRGGHRRYCSGGSLMPRRDRCRLATRLRKQNDSAWAETWKMSATGRIIPDLHMQRQSLGNLQPSMEMQRSVLAIIYFYHLFRGWAAPTGGSLVRRSQAGQLRKFRGNTRNPRLAPKVEQSTASCITRRKMACGCRFLH